MFNTSLFTELIDLTLTVYGFLDRHSNSLTQIYWSSIEVNKIFLCPGSPSTHLGRVGGDIRFKPPLTRFCGRQNKLVQPLSLWLGDWLQPVVSYPLERVEIFFHPERVDANTHRNLFSIIDSYSCFYYWACIMY